MKLIACILVSVVAAFMLAVWVVPASVQRLDVDPIRLLAGLSLLGLALARARRLILRAGRGRLL